MASDDISDRVLAFIAERIDTVPQLEALLLLWEDPTRTWSVDEMAARIYVTSDAAAKVLQALQRRQLAAPADAQLTCYRYDGRWDVSGTLMTEVAETYRRHVVRIATFIHSGASTSVREFARAFDLKKDR